MKAIPSRLPWITACAVLALAPLGCLALRFVLWLDGDPVPFTFAPRLADILASLPFGLLAAVPLWLGARAWAEQEAISRSWAAMGPAADGLLAVDVEGKIAYANASGAALFGQSPEELIGRPLEDALPMSATPPAGTSSPVVARRKGGEPIPLDVRMGNPLAAPDGRLVTPVFLRDATVTKRTHEMLNAREAHLRLVVEQMPAILWTTDRSLRITSTKGAGLAALRVRAEELIGVSMLECLDSNDVESTPIAAHLKAVEGQSLSYEMEWRGRTFQVRVDPLRDPNQKIVGTVGILLDVTDHKQALAGLEARERQQAAVADLGLRALAGLPLAALMSEAASAVSQTLGVEFCKVLEFRPEDQSFQARAGTGWGEDIGATTPPIADPQTEYTLRTGEPVIVEDLRSESRFCPSQSLVCRGAVSGVSAAIRGKNGPLGVLSAHSASRRSFSQDDLNFLQGVANVVAAGIERCRAEDAQGRLVAILEATPDVVAIARQDLRLAYLNYAGRMLLGMRHDQDPSSRTMADLYPSEARGTDLSERLRQAAARGVWSGEASLTDIDGKAIPVSQVMISHRSAGGQVEYYSTIARDLSERLGLEEQIRQAQKMDAIGKLAGGIAHDFNNLLCIINGYSMILLQELPEGNLMRAQLEQVCKAGERAASLTRQLLAFSRKQMLAPQVLNLNSLVSDMERMLHRLIGEDILLVTHLGPVLASVRADKGQLEQVLLNLAVNARDAMPQGGKITLSTANIVLDGAALKGKPEVPPGQYVMLMVSDTGCGMMPDVLARVFEPFFTTKPAGKGTGLGLSTVYGIVKQSGGHIEVESQPRRGTTFRVYLPRLEEAPSASEAPALPAQGGRETVLVVEDEEGVRLLALTVLREKGYKVLEACDGREALEVCSRHTGKIDLVLSDAVMPNMGGGELARRLKETRPDSKVLFMSGFTDSALVRHGVAGGEIECLLKPFAPAVLAKAVRIILDGGALSPAML
jgi:PAS domain S-box-containing protein